jgi:hypothetical protein
MKLIVQIRNRIEIKDPHVPEGSATTAFQTCHQRVQQLICYSLSLLLASTEGKPMPRSN